jgi:hypothetical protein
MAVNCEKSSAGRDRAGVPESNTTLLQFWISRTAALVRAALYLRFNQNRYQKKDLEDF